MLKFLLWLNHIIIVVSINMNKKIERHIEYKKIKKLIRKNLESTELINCQDGIIIIIRKNEKDLKAADWIQKNLPKENNHKSNHELGKQKEASANAYCLAPVKVDPHKEELKNEVLNESSTNSYKITNLKVDFQSSSDINAMDTTIIPTPDKSANALIHEPDYEPLSKVYTQTCNNKACHNYPIRKYRYDKK